MKRYLSLTAAMVLLAGAVSPFSLGDQGGEKKPAEGVLDSPYYPLKIGNTWKYTSGGKEVIVKVAAIEMIEGMSCARLETDVSGGKGVEFLTVKEEGVYRVRANNADIKPPLLILKLPPKNGESWVIDSMVQNYAIKGKMAIGEEKLTVVKTAYDTVSVKSSDMTMGEQSTAVETWYAKDVGMVKQHFRLPTADLDVVLELESFTPGK